MRLHYTITRGFSEDKILDNYIERNQIHSSVTADFEMDLMRQGYKNTERENKLILVYTLLIEDYELSSLMLTVDGVQVIRNKPSTEFKNKVRSKLSWILK